MFEKNLIPWNMKMKWSTSKDPVLSDHFLKRMRDRAVIFLKIVPKRKQGAVIMVVEDNTVFKKIPKPIICATLKEFYKTNIGRIIQAE